MGKVLGGSSVLNYGIFNRGNPRDFDEWAKATGDDSWAYKNVLKYFKKSETYNGEVMSSGKILNIFLNLPRKF
jgi:choline dehydrogenase